VLSGPDAEFTEYGMIDQPKATLVAREAFELADSGQLEAAVERYREALSLAHPDYYCLPDYHGEFASVLARLGQNEEALHHYSRALELEQRQAREPDGPGVVMARYFLAQHLVSMKRPTEALSTLQPSLGQAGKLEAQLRAVEAEAANRAGDTERARHAAALALQSSTSDSQRTHIRERLREILKDEAG